MEAKVKNENYITVQGWMVNNLRLKGNELLIYAIVYGFSQDGESWFTGSLTYLRNWLGVSKNTVRTALDNLVEKGYLLKGTISINGITINRYKNNYGVSKIDTPVQNNDDSVSKIDTGVYQKLTRGVSKIDPNNNIYNNILNNNIYSESKDQNKKKAYGELKNVLLTDEEHKKLKEKNLLYMIDELSFYISSKGKKYSSHYATICRWSRNNKDQKNTSKQVGQVI